MPVQLNLVFDKSTQLPRLRKSDIEEGLSDAAKILEHNLEPSATEFLHRGIAACQRWLDNPNENPKWGRQTITAFLKRTRGNLIVICHPEYRPLSRIIHAARTFADALGPENSSPDLIGFEDYGDVFEPLSKILRCEICFEGAEYNKVNPMTNRQYTWYEIIQAILSHVAGVELPGNYCPSTYNISECKIDRSNARRLAVDLWRICHIMNMDAQSVVWQLVKFSYYHETPRGPKMSLRTGQWGNLASHAYRMLQWLTPLNMLDIIRHVEIDNASKTMYETIRCVQSQWFDSLDSEVDFTPSIAAFELNRRLAGYGEPRSDRSKRSEPMLDFKNFRMTIERCPPSLHNLSRVLFDDGFEDQFDFYEDEDGDLDPETMPEGPDGLPVPNGLQPLAHTVTDHLTANGYEFMLETTRRTTQTPIVTMRMMRGPLD